MTEALDESQSIDLDTGAAALSAELRSAIRGIISEEVSAVQTSLQISLATAIGHIANLQARVDHLEGQLAAS